MKPIRIVVAAIIFVFTIAAIGAGIVVAKSPAVWDRFIPSMVMGQAGSYGMMGGTGTDGEDYTWMIQIHAWMSESGGMHEIVWKGLADALGLTTSELNAELSNGKTITQIADSKGIQKEQLAAALESSVKAGLDQAVADQVITQEQADQMLKHMGGNYLWMLDHMSSGDSAGAGGCHQNNSTPDKNTNS